MRLSSESPIVTSIRVKSSIKIARLCCRRVTSSQYVCSLLLFFFFFFCFFLCVLKTAFVRPFSVLLPRSVDKRAWEAIISVKYERRKKGRQRTTGDCNFALVSVSRRDLRSRLGCEVKSTRMGIYVAHAHVCSFVAIETKSFGKNYLDNVTTIVLMTKC